MASGDVGKRSLTARAPAVPAVREEALLIARGAGVDASDLVHARVPQRALCDCAQVERPAVVAESLRHVRADLVAARADAGADEGGDRAAEGSDRRLHDTVGEPTPAGVHQADRRGAG